MRIVVINGPNINLLGIRQPEIYGGRSYSDLVAAVHAAAHEENVETEVLQSNHEGTLIDFIQGEHGRADGLILNPGGYTHTSIAILDALSAVNIPTIEVHISDVEKREAFRQISYIRPYCIATISGEGIEGYTRALRFLKEYLNK